MIVVIRNPHTITIVLIGSGKNIIEISMMSEIPIYNRSTLANSFSWNWFILFIIQIPNNKLHSLNSVIKDRKEAEGRPLLLKTGRRACSHNSPNLPVPSTQKPLKLLVINGNDVCFYKKAVFIVYLEVEGGFWVYGLYFF